MGRLSIYKTGLVAWLALALTWAAPGAAQDASWLAAPPSSNFNDAANWTPTTVPTGTASFGTSTGTNITFANDTTLGGWTFNTGASNYIFTSNHVLMFTGGGIVVNDGSARIINNSFLQFAYSSTAGSAGIANNGILDFFDTSTASNASITNNGSGYFYSGSTAGSASITSNIYLQFAGSSTAGSASIINNNLLQFTDTSTASNASITNNSFLQFASSSTAGNASITNGSVGARTDFAESSGPVNNGQLSAGSIAGSGQFYLGANQLTVGGNNLSTIVSGVISDCGPSGLSCSSAGATGGALIKAGTGTLTLSGSNIYTGATTVDAGTLNVTGSLAASSPVSVNTGAVLAGTGSVGSVSINSGGTLVPGDGTAGSSMSLGSVALQAGAMYVVMLNPATASSANVTGAATLGDATVKAIYANGSYISRQYTILTAGNISGTFGSLVNTNLPANFTTRLSYDPTHAYLNLTLNFVPPAPPTFTPFTPNQRNVANALINSFNTAGGIPLVFGALTPAGLTQVSGEAATGSLQPTFDAMNLFLGILSDPSSPAAAMVQPQTVRPRPMPKRATVSVPMRRETPHVRRTSVTPMPQSIARRLQWPISSPRAGACGPQATAARRPPTVMRRSALVPRPQVSPASRSAPTTASRRSQPPASPWRAAAPISMSPKGWAADTPTCSRPAPSFDIPSARPTSPVRSLTAGRTSPPTAS